MPPNKEDRENYFFTVEPKSFEQVFLMSMSLNRKTFLTTPVLAMNQSSGRFFICFTYKKDIRIKTVRMYLLLILYILYYMYICREMKWIFNNIYFHFLCFESILYSYIKHK